MRLTSAALLALGVLTLGAQTTKDWQSEFPVNRMTLGVKGSNPWFNLTPGYQLTYRHGTDAETVTVLNETRVIDGVETRVIEDRETNGCLYPEDLGPLKPVTRRPALSWRCAQRLPWAARRKGVFQPATRTRGSGAPPSAGPAP